MSTATFEQAVAEERRARERQRRLDKARRVKARQRSRSVWGEVRRRIVANGCQCDLRPGMTHEELVELGSGCTGIEARRARGEGGGSLLGPSGWVCSVLAFYREKVR